MYYIYKQKGKDNKKIYHMNFIPSSYQSEMKLITGVIIIMQHCPILSQNKINKGVTNFSGQNIAKT